MGRLKIHTDEEFNQIYKDVINLVKLGLTINGALQKLKYNRSFFYLKMNTQQKLELQLIKTLNTKYGKANRSGYVHKENSILGLNNDY